MHKIYSYINTVGLSLGLTAALLIILFLNYEFNYDTWSPDLRHIYRVEEFNNLSSSTGTAAWNDICDARTGYAFRSELPGVRALTMVSPSWWEKQLVFELDGNTFFQPGMMQTDSFFFKVFPYTFLSGSPSTALSNPNSVVLTETTAQKIFNSVDVAGRSINLRRSSDDSKKLCTITGVIRVPAGPTELNFSGIFHIGFEDHVPDQPGEHTPVKIFASLHSPGKTGSIFTDASRIYLQHLAKLAADRKALGVPSGLGYVPGIRLRTLQLSHLEPAGREGIMERLKPLMAVSIVLLVISIINFANLSIAQAVFKAKEIAIRKVSGASRLQLVFEYMLRIARLVGFAFFTAGLTAIFLLPFFNRAFGTAISGLVDINLPVFVGEAGCIFLLTVILAGIYPAIYVTAYQPVKVLKGELKKSRSRISVTSILLVAQFSIAILFIISRGVMEAQLYFIQNTDAGFQPQGLLDIKAAYNPRLLRALNSTTGIQTAGYTSQLFGEPDHIKVDAVCQGLVQKVNFVSVDAHTLQAMGVKLYAGRLFSELFQDDSLNTLVINESAAKAFHLKTPGFLIGLGHSRQKIVGIIKDFHFAGFDKAIAPTVYAVNSNYGVADKRDIIVRLNRKPGEVIPVIESVWRSVYGSYPFSFAFLEDTYQQAVTPYRNAHQVFTLFSFVALAMSLIGLFALATYIIQGRIKEIGIRMVLGASITRIFVLVNSGYVYIISLAFIIACPVAVMFSSDWLSNFAYKVKMPLAPFISAAAIVFALTFLTVGFQVWRAAKIKPVETLRNE